VVPFDEISRDQEGERRTAVALGMERRREAAWKKTEFSSDRDKVKTRIDQLLHRLKGLDI
jgi:hypothetical protein